MNQLKEALLPFRSNMPRATREIEILRFVGRLDGDAASARKSILDWVQRKAGTKLPENAWQGEDFELLHSGRNAAAINLNADQISLWALRHEDPDNSIPGRTWTHEVTIGGRKEGVPFLTVRQIMTTQEDNYSIEAAVPVFLNNIAENGGLRVDEQEALGAPSVLESEDEAEALGDWLIDPNRRMPVYMLSVADASSVSNEPLIDAKKLARNTLGLAQVVVVPAMLTWYFTERFGKERATFSGAIRSYLPGFSEDSDPYGHRLVLSERLQTEAEKQRCSRWLRNLAALESRRRTTLGKDVIPYLQVKSAIANLQVERAGRTEVTETAQVRALRAKVSVLEEQIKSLENESTYYVQEHDLAVQRAEESEHQNRSLTYRIQSLEQKADTTATGLGQKPKLPVDWVALVDWCEQQFAGRLVLTSVARRGLKRPDFESVEVVARCLEWLATEARDSFRGESELILRDCRIVDGVLNAPCGGDTYEFDWSGRRIAADWHVKSGGNTRDPKRCLRIYYAWDDVTSQIIVSDAPAHKRTAAT
ncbi:MAG: hypothetical protein NXH88_19330 [Hyphomonas sp.]|nr:hypothetical protein [Hyphomonas sp.]